MYKELTQYTWCSTPLVPITSFADHNKLATASDSELSVVVTKLRAEWNFMIFVVCRHLIIVYWRFFWYFFIAIRYHCVGCGLMIPSSAAVQARCRCLYARFGFPSLQQCPLGVACSSIIALVGIICDLWLICWYIHQHIQDQTCATILIPPLWWRSGKSSWFQRKLWCILLEISVSGPICAIVSTSSLGVWGVGRISGSNC